MDFHDLSGDSPDRGHLPGPLALPMTQISAWPPIALWTMYTIWFPDSDMNHGGSVDYEHQHPRWEYRLLTCAWLLVALQPSDINMISGSSIECQNPNDFQCYLSPIASWIQISAWCQTAVQAAHIKLALGSSSVLRHWHDSASLCWICITLFLHPSHQSIINSFLDMALEIATQHSVYFG